MQMHGLSKGEARSDYVHALDAETTLYAPATPFNTGFLKRGEHSIYYEECGNPDGMAVFFVHGGPGAGCAPTHRRLFDPEKYRVVLFDQRGGGRSEPYGSLKQNTTHELVEDMEGLRIKLGIDKFILFGGSWGSTLALAYGVAYPDNCLGFVLRGIFLGSHEEINWFLYDMGRFFPEAYERFVSHISPAERSDILSAYYRRLTSPSRSIAMAAANHWAAYENSCATLRAVLRDGGSSAYTLALLEAHYFLSDCFMPEEYLLGNIHTIRHLPAYIVQGRYDIICPPFSAKKLADIWGDKAKLKLMDNAGHSAFESSIVPHLLRGLDAISKQAG